ncbi:metabotropic glutamate receptor 7-like [Dendronephthya gigantea]|uniref:metabotropic glutamate receptor 7-like n=1 Tax=Dendronephthya gigantea TaxID=151771 RepID=UPI00106CE4CF|nr:metabotropic glutamate receptor 7-like [Dendronephthya gigantea]
MKKVWIVFVAIVCLRATVQGYTPDPHNRKPKEYSSQPRDKILQRRRRQIARLNGDFKLGAMLPIHISKAGLCSGIYVDGIMLVEAIIFALREVKHRKLLPEGITLGYEIRDTCNSVIVAQRHTLDIVFEATVYAERNNKYMNDSNDSTLSYSTRDYKQSSNSLIAVVGAGNSEITVAVNRVLSAFNIPQIGFASTSRYLSEKMRFPSFLRTVPPDTYQVEGLVAMFETFSWKYVGILVSDGDYGRPLADSFTSSAKRKGICIAYEHLVPFHVNLEDAKSIVRSLNSKTNIEIVVILLPEPDVKTMLLAMLHVGHLNKTLIASDSWSRAINDLKFSKVIAGALGLAHQYKKVKRFEDYFLNLKPNKNYWNPWFNETWEHIFNCVLPKSDHRYGNRTFLYSRKAEKFCNIEKQHLKRQNFTRFHYVSSIINAVFAVANGLRKFHEKKHISSLSPKKLLETLREMTFQKYDGENITFDENGDVTGKFNLVNIRPGLSVKNVGIWNGEYLEIEDFKRIWWNTKLRQPPNGVCSVPCRAGWYKLASKTDPQCCWTCQRCHVGTISNRTGTSKCVLCPENHTPNENQTACVFVPLEYLDWHSFWTISIVIMALISVFILMFVAMLFARFVNTPVVKSSNRELSLLLGIGLFLTFLVPFAFAGKPTSFKCIISQMMFCIGCALALSAMLFRTLRIVMLFEFKNQRRWLLKNKYQIVLTIALTFAELTYCLLWVGVNPPGVKTVTIRPTKRYLVCDFNKYWYSGSHLLLIFLSVVCTVLAVKGRKLPKNFNEVRHIGLSMFTFNIVWVVFMCAQYGASLEYDVKINCFAMIISSLMILVPLFGPKVFVLLFRAHLNRKEEFEAEVRRYSFGVPNGNVSSSATSLRRGSSVTFRTANPSNDQFLSVDTDDFKRKRSQSFDVMSTRHYQASTANRSRKFFSKGTQTSFFAVTDLVNTIDLGKGLEIPPIIVKLEAEQDSNDFCIHEGKYNNVTNTESPVFRTTGDFEVILDDETNTKTHTIRGSAQKRPNKLPDGNMAADENDELTNLLKDLRVQNSDISPKRGNISDKSSEVSNNGELTIFDTSPFGERTDEPERTENDFLQFNLKHDGVTKPITLSQRDGYDRETVL